MFYSGLVMIRFIAAIDEKYGLADEHGIPWQGKLPADVAYFRSKTLNGNVLMGLVTYNEFSEPLGKRHNFVLNNTDQKLRPGFEEVRDLDKFSQTLDGDLWIIGGAGVFAQTIQMADELYLTRIDEDYGCTKFFPSFEDKFKLVSKSEDHTENGITFRFETWQRI